MFDHVRIVLVETSHPGNIGAAARAMKNMSLSQLYLVNPLEFPSSIAHSRAAGADDLLEKAIVCADLESALSDCQLIFATSARSRTLSWPHCTPRECAQIIRERSQEKVAILFGNERIGLSNEQLAHSHYQVHIPTAEDFSSLNLAAAVQIMAYELKNLSISSALEADVREDPLAEHVEVLGFYEHLQKILLALEFLDPKQPKMLMARLQRLFNRAQLSKTEINILRGVLAAMQKKIKL